MTKAEQKRVEKHIKNAINQLNRALMSADDLAREEEGARPAGQ